MQNLDLTQAHIHLDKIFLSPSILLIAGWAADKAPIDTIRLFSEDNELNQHSMFAPRGDVVEALGVTDSQSCTGFVCVANVVDCMPESIKVSINETTVELSQFDRDKNTTPDDVLGFVGAHKAQFLHQVENLQIVKNKRSAKSFIDFCELTLGNLLLLEGWVMDESHTEVIVSNLYGDTQDLTANTLRFSRPDVTQELEIIDGSLEIGISFAARLTIAPIGLKVKLIPAHSQPITVEVNSSSRKIEIQSLLKRQLDRIDFYQQGFLESGHQVISNIIQALWDSESKNNLPNEVIKTSLYGDAVQQPVVSVIIPIYGRYDFMQHQLLAFSQDPDMKHHEIIYVLDDPKLEREFDIAANGVFQTFGHSFSTVFSGSNLGFAGANNLGAKVAKGKYVLALNSDVMPTRHGWLSRLVEKYEQVNDCGILGTRLVYEDETIQHLGMVFAEDPYYPGIWMNQHPLKGMPNSLVSVKATQPVEAVTGACMLIERNFYQELGGFDTGYVIGDFEDSDLCMKVHSANRGIYLDSEEKLVHLERLSQSLVDSGDWKFKLTILNGIRQKEKWANKMLEVKAKHA